MAYYYSGSGRLITIYGPDDLIAGQAESEALARVWVERLAEREPEIRAALEEEDYTRAERIWAEVEAEARRPVPAV